MTIAPFVRPPLSTLADYPSLSDSLLFQLNGLVVVFIALGSIWGLMEVTGLFFRRHSAASSKPATAALASGISPSAALPAVPARAAAASPSAPPSADEDLTAVIAASVAAVVGAPHRIHAVTIAADQLDWAREGRREIFASHHTR